MPDRAATGEFGGPPETAGTRAGGRGSAAILATLVVLGVSGCATAPGVPLAGPLRVAAAPAVQLQDGRVRGLEWLQGCWRGTLEGGATYEEIWMSPLGGTMLGMARMSRDGRMLSFEFMRIEDHGESVMFSAQPSGRAPTAFHMVESEEGSVVFANDGHDFPQRIRYRQVLPDSIHATIEGSMDEQRREFHFPLARSRCPGPAES